MKILISESQLKRLVIEQGGSEGAMDDVLNAAGKTGYTPRPQDYTANNLAKGAVNTVVNFIKHMDSHDWAQLGEMASVLFIPPPAGEFVAAAIGAADAANYFYHGNNKMGTIALVLAAIPAMSGFAEKIPGFKEMGANGIKLLSDKLAKGITTLGPEESKLMQWILSHENLVKQEYSVFVHSVADKIARKGVNVGIENGVEKGAEYAYDNPQKVLKFAYGAVGNQSVVASGAVGALVVPAYKKIMAAVKPQPSNGTIATNSKPVQKSNTL